MGREAYMAPGENLSKLTNEILADRWKKQHDEDALGVLIKRNRPFVIKTAKKMRLFPSEGKLKSSVLDYDDVLSIGDYAICKAAQRYEIEKGNKFLTYAGWWVFCELSKAQKDAYGCVSLPAKVYANVVAFSVEICRIEEQDSHIDDHDAFEMAVVNMGLTEQEGYQLYSYARAYLSWMSLDDDRFSSEDSGTRVLDYQIDHSCEDRAVRKDRLETIDFLIKNTPSLTDRDVYILRAKYALGANHCEMSYSDIGKSINCTRERVRQLCEQAVIELGKTAQRMGLTPDMIAG